MNKKTLISAVVLTAVLLLVALTAVLAMPDKPGKAGAMNCVLDITYDVHEVGEDPFWLGTLTGPRCDVEGTIEFYKVPDEYIYGDEYMRFVESFVIRPYAGGELHGKNYGLWDLSNFDFWANGRVHVTTEEWDQLVGYTYSESGTTSNPADGLPITAPDGSSELVPGNR